jgi:PPOX class probable F420-dependent enzyme
VKGADVTLTMTAAEREAFLSEPRIGVLSVADRDGRAPLTVPIWYDYRPGGQIWFSTGAGTRKMERIRAAGRVSLLAQTEQLPYRYVSVEGPVSAIDPATPEERRTLATRYLSADDADRYLEATGDVAATMMIVRMDPEHWLSRDYTKSG